MRLALFCHSLLSDWNHGNAHFLRGVVTELVHQGHTVEVYEPEDAWSVRNLVAEAGPAALNEVRRVYPALSVTRYRPGFDPESALAAVDACIVHEWSDPALVARIGALRARGRFTLLFHDTHHRAVSDPEAMARYDLRHYDGVLAFGRVLRDLYVSRGWARRAFLWHEAADARVFAPRPGVRPRWDVVWVGNWGDDEREAELFTYLLDPIARVGAKAAVFGVRYPARALAALRERNIHYGGWTPNYRVPALFADARVTVHVPRRYYRTALPGIPTIRPFEALAAGIPLVSAPWDDAEGLFTPGEDYLVAETGAAMEAHLAHLLADGAARGALAQRGRDTVLRRHTCAHRAAELLAILAQLRAGRASASSPPRPVQEALDP